jgi:hypothetical protein
MARSGQSALVAALAVAAVAAAGPISASGSPEAGAAAKRGPKVEQLIVFRGGTAVGKTVRANAATVAIGRRRCALASGTPLATLVRSRPGRLRLRDFGACSKRPADGGGLFVRAIRNDVNSGQRGWVYKVGRKAATAGAADPSGPFGAGRLHSGQRVTWFYCVLTNRSCQRTLDLAAVAEGGGAVRVTVRAYDDNGKGIPAAGAIVRGGGGTAVAGADGVARLALAPGGVRLHATQPGAIRSFTERVTVR